MKEKYNFKCIKEEFQKDIFNRAVNIFCEKHMVGLDVFTSGGKSIISGELIHFLGEKLHRDVKVLVITSKSVWANLQVTYTSDKVGLSEKNLYFISNTSLSRKNSLESLVKSLGDNLIDDIDVIVFDECHAVFGDNISKEIEKAKDFIYSKYVIAMTATRINGIACIDSLNRLVGNDNCVTFNLNQAVHTDVINKMHVAVAQLKLESGYIETVNNVKDINCKSVSKFIRYIKALDIGSFDKVIQSNIEKEIKYRDNSVTQLDASNGARVMAFFNRISDIENIKEDLVKAIRNMYNKNGTDVNIRFIEYTSESTNEECESAISILSNQEGSLIENTVDIIATCEKGAESYHPENVQLGLIFGDTSSLRKLLQTLGRFVNLKRYQTNSPLIMRFITYKHKPTYSILDGRRTFDDRVSNMMNISQYFTDEVNSIDKMLDGFKDSIDLHVSVLDSTLIDQIRSMEALNDLSKNYTSLLEYINKNLDIIDKCIGNNGYAGNIEAFLKAREAEARKKKDIAFLDNKYAECYKNVRQMVMYNTEKFKSTGIVNGFIKLGYRNYIGYSDTIADINNTKFLYDYINSDRYKEEGLYTYNIDEPVLAVEIEDKTTCLGYKKVRHSIRDAYMLGIITPSASILIRSKKDLLYRIYDSTIDNFIAKISAGKHLAISKSTTVNFQLEQLIIAIKYIKDVKDKVRKMSRQELNACKNQLVASYRYIEVYLNRLRSKNTKENAKEDIFISNILYIITDGYIGDFSNELNNKKYDNVYYYVTIYQYLESEKLFQLSNKVSDWAYDMYNTSKISKTDDLMVNSISFGNYTAKELVGNYMDTLPNIKLLTGIIKSKSVSKISNDTIKEVHKLERHGLIPKKFRSNSNLKKVLDMVY